MSHVKFREVSLSASKTGKCAVCGKRRKRTKKFWQTLNPWNKNADGFPKTALEIQQEIREAAAVWVKEPITGCCDSGGRG